MKMKNLVKAAIVLSDSPGAAKGVQAGDLILNFAGVDWTTGDFNRNIVAETAETEKTLIFARKQEDGSFIIFEHTFPAGRIGLHMMDFWGEMTEYGQVLEDYKEFMTEG